MLHLISGTAILSKGRAGGALGPPAIKIDLGTIYITEHVLAQMGDSLWTTSRVRECVQTSPEPPVTARLQTITATFWDRGLHAWREFALIPALDASIHVSVRRAQVVPFELSAAGDRNALAVTVSSFLCDTVVALVGSPSTAAPETLVITNGTDVSFGIQWLEAPPVAAVMTTAEARVLNPPEHARSYTSVWSGDRPGTGHARSMLGSDQAWSAGQNEQGQCLDMDVGERMQIYGVVISGRGHTGQDQKVTRVDVAVADKPQGPYTYCGEYECDTANEHEQRKVAFKGGAVAGRYVRLSPKAWQSHVSMRCGKASALLLPLPNIYPLGLKRFALARDFALTFTLCINRCGLLVAGQAVCQGNLSRTGTDAATLHIPEQGDTLKFRLQISGCEWSRLYRVTRGVAGKGAPMRVPTSDGGAVLIRVDVSGRVATLRPAFVFNNHLPESVEIELSCAVGQGRSSKKKLIRPGDTANFYHFGGGGVRIESLRCECEGGSHSFQSRGAFALEFMHGKEVQDPTKVKLLHDQAGQIYMTCHIVFDEGPYGATLFSDLWLVNRVKLPLLVFAPGKWAGQCWPSLQPPTTVCSLSAGSVECVHVSIPDLGFADKHKINVARVGQGALPLGAGQSLHFTVERGCGQFRRTRILTIGELVAMGEPREVDLWTMSVSVPRVAIKFCDMDTGRVCDTPSQAEHWPQRKFLSGDLMQIVVDGLNLECSAGSSAQQGAIAAARVKRPVTVTVHDLRKAQSTAVLAINQVDLSGTLSQTPRTAATPQPIPEISISAAVECVSGSIDDVFLLRTLAVQHNLMAVWQELDNEPGAGGAAPTASASGFLRALRNEHGPDPSVQMLIRDFKLTGNPPNKQISINLDFQRNTDWILPQVAELSVLPKGSYPGQGGWRAQSITLCGVAGNVDSLVFRVQQEATDHLKGSAFALIFRQVLPRLNQVLKIGGAAAAKSGGVKKGGATAAGATLAVAAGGMAIPVVAGVAGVVVARGAAKRAVSSAAERGRIAQGRRADDSFRPGDFATGAAMNAKDAVGSTLDTVAGGVKSLFGSSAEARWVWEDSKGPLGKAAYRLNKGRWNKGSFSTVAAELAQQSGPNARRRVVVRYMEHDSEREQEFPDARTAAEFLRRK
jgi:hypothetical protein